MKVTVKEILEVLALADNVDVLSFPQMMCLRVLADRIREHGIAVDYVPMSDDELLAIFDERETFPDYVLARSIEQAVLNRQ